MVVLLGSFACNAGRILPYRRPSGTYGDSHVRGEGAHGVGEKGGKEEKIKSFSNGASRSSTTLVFGMMTDVDDG